MRATAISKTLLVLSVALCAAGCSRGMIAQAQAEAAERNRIDPKIEADWDNLVNETRPTMAFVNNTLNEVREIQREEAAADAANKQSAK